VTQSPDRAAWRGAGFVDDEIDSWIRWGIPLPGAVAWRSADVLTGSRAAQWTIAGVTPETVAHWRAAGVESTEAVRWHELGFAFAQVRDCKRRGLSPEKALGEAKKSAERKAAAAKPVAGQVDVPVPLFEGDDDSLAIVVRMVSDAPPEWAAEEISAADAKVWALIGLQPAEAGRLARQGCAPEDVARQWWRAGIAYDEVADWIGAGFSPAEAAEQRAQGVTAEQAAALRALRNNDEGVDW